MRFGAHVSISGHIHLAVDRAVAIGCECLQIFVGNPRQWRRIEYAEADVALFRQKRARARLDPLVAHGVYLINLASPDEEFYARSVASLIAGVEGIHRLGGLGVITHLGSRMGQPWEEAAARVVAALRVVLETTEGAMVILENAAGAGGAIGGSFDELAAILDALEWHPRLGVCLDTAHLFASGFDIRTPEGVARTLRAFDRTVGLRRLRAFHLNDSKTGLGTNLDRHENIGQGQIGVKGFRALIHHRAARRLPGLIETPGIDRRGADRRNLEILKRLRLRAPQKRRAKEKSRKPPRRRR
ncbi:MAG: deoxyribonuclease IV [Armatimonadetes bacterium]|nr:deoxyribonuclease IV [Armatimonadota bacterium]